MPVVNINSDIAAPNVDPARVRGRPICATFNVSNLSTDSVGSRYKLLDLPSEAILDIRTMFKVDLWGYADIRIGSFSDPAALISATRLSAANQSPRAFGDAKHGLPLWQQMGMAADPGGMIGIYVHGSVAVPTGAGSMRGEIWYLFR